MFLGISTRFMLTFPVQSAPRLPGKMDSEAHKNTLVDCTHSCGTMESNGQGGCKCSFNRRTTIVHYSISKTVKGRWGSSACQLCLVKSLQVQGATIWYTNASLHPFIPSPFFALRQLWTIQPLIGSLQVSSFHILFPFSLSFSTAIPLPLRSYIIYAAIFSRLV